MAYIPYTYVPIGSSGAKKTVYTLPYNGVKLSKDEDIIPDGFCKYSLNMDIGNGRIESRCGQKKNISDFLCDGTFHGSAKNAFFGNLVFHAGTKLYALNEKSKEPVLVGEGLPDKKSLICNFMSKLYIYCESRIFSLDKNLAFKEEMPTPVILYKDVHASLPGSGTRLDVPFNALAPRITVVYSENKVKYYNLPCPLDTSRPYEIYSNSKLVDNSTCTVTEKLITLPDTFIYGADVVITVTYYLKNPEEEGYVRAIEGCNLVCDFGGKASGGTRLFFTGNPDYEGRYYMSDFQDPLYCASDNYETIGDGSSNITALLKMYGNLIIFTESSVYKMSYTLNQDGAFFSTKQISDYVGCDCPDSLQLIDNRAVFLNSRKGVFIVDSTDEAGEHNIKPLSGNVIKGKEYGLLSVDPKVLKSAASADFDRKYMLFAGDRAYVWDYDKSAYYDSNSYSKAQSRLCWYIYDNVEGKNFCGLGTRLISFAQDADCVRLCEYPIAEASTDFESVLESGNMEVFSDGKRRFVTGMGIRLSRCDSCSIKLTFFADGEEYYSKTVSPKKLSKEKAVFSLPRKALYNFGFKLTATDMCAIDGIEFFSREISE